MEKIYKKTNPTSSDNISAGYALNDVWVNIITYDRYTQVSDGEWYWTAVDQDTFIIPNPSTSILNKLINTMKLKYETQSFVSTTNTSKSGAQSTVVISQLLNKVGDYLPFIESYMKILVVRIETLQSACTQIHENIQQIREKLQQINDYYG